MTIDEYFKKMKLIQDKILYFINDEYNIEENYNNLIHILIDENIFNYRNKLKLTLILLSKISRNHNRRSNLITKIENLHEISYRTNLFKFRNI